MKNVKNQKNMKKWKTIQKHKKLTKLTWNVVRKLLFPLPKPFYNIRKLLFSTHHAPLYPNRIRFCDVPTDGELHPQL